MTEDNINREKVTSLSIDIVVTIALISFLVYLAFNYVAPFFSILIWSVILAVALHPLYVKLMGKMGGRAGGSATVIALIGLTVILGPTIMIVDAVLDSIFEWTGRVTAGEMNVPAPSEGVKEWPLVGDRIHKIWLAAHNNLTETLGQYSEQLNAFAGKMLGAGAGLMLGVLQFAVSIIVAAIFLRYADTLVGGTRMMAKKITARRGDEMVSMSSATIRNVARGVLGVAFIQGSLAAVGIIGAGLPFAGFLAAATLMFCIVQAPPLAIIPLIIYVWSAETTTVALIFTIYMVPVLMIDNVLKPILMGRGLKTPMIVILIGVIGGTLTQGMLGLFIGPVILALAYEMVVVWVTGGIPEDAADEAAPKAADG